MSAYLWDKYSFKKALMLNVLPVPLFCHKPGVLAQKMVKSVVPEMERSPTTNWIFRDR